LDQRRRHGSPDWPGDGRPGLWQRDVEKTTIDDKRATLGGVCLDVIPGRARKGANPESRANFGVFDWIPDRRANARRPE